MTLRMVVTGIGIVSPLGCGTERVWRRLIDGCSGLRLLGDDIVGDLPAKVGGTVQDKTADPEGGFDPEASIPGKELKKMDRFIQMAMVASNLPSDQPMSTHWIAPHGMALLDELGLGDKVRRFAPPVPSMLYGIDDVTGRIECGADHPLMHSMRRDGLKRGIVTLCIGGGQGIALALDIV